MSGHFSPENGNVTAARGERGSTTTVLLLVLLLVVAAAGYLYYFTDLIRPKEEAKPAPVQPAQVKKPIPPRPEQQAAAPVKPEGAQPPPGTPAPATPQPAPAAGQKPAPVPPPAKPAPPKTAKVEAPPKPAPAPPAAPAAAVPATAKPAATPVKPVAAPEKKEAAPVKAARKPAAKRKKGAYALLIGDFVPDATFAAVQAKLKKNGVTPVRKSAVTAAEPMNRLFVAEFTDQDAAEAELQKLKKLTADAFLIADNGRYSLYAGSYFSSSRVASEMKRLGAKGVKPVVKKTQATIKVVRMTAGSYGSEDEACKDALRLKKLGIAAKVVKAGK